MLKCVRLCGVDHYSITELRSSEWRSQPSCPRGQLGQVTLYTDTTVPPILSGATTRLLVNLFEDSFRLHQRYRQCTTAVQSCSPNLWGMGGSDRQDLCVSGIRFACSLADLLKSVSNHTRPRADVRPGLPASVLNAPL